jgi:ribosome-associated protein
MIHISQRLQIDKDEIKFKFIRASGPGGQNVNKVSTAAQLRFNVKTSQSLPDDVKQRLMLLAGKRINAEGSIVISAQRFRTQEQNRLDAIDRLATLIRQASYAPKKRKKTGPTKASIKNRIVAKRIRSSVKQMRNIKHTSEE